MSTIIVGVDCATKDDKIGIAKAVIENNRWHIKDAQKCSAKEKAEAVIARWYRETPISLLALDAPLGWPSSLGAALINHKAGESIAELSDKLFHRETDNRIKLPSGRKPLEVGANLIARTAKSALDLLEALRAETGQSIPLAWETGVPQQLSAIEVYPAATRFSLYPTLTRLSDKATDRLQVLEAIAQTIDVSQVRAEAEKSDHVFDAVLCVVAGIEFIEGRSTGPDDLSQAQQEGWIWVA